MAILWLDACLKVRLPDDQAQPLKPMPTKNAWLAPLLGQKAVPESKFKGDKSTAIWLPNEKTATQWLQYVKDTNIVDNTPPPAPTNVELNGNILTWEADADLESGIAQFLILRDGKVIGKVPEDPKNRFGRPLFQGLQYSDTPAVPLVQMKFEDRTAKAGKKHQYQVISINTVGLQSN